MERIFLAQKGRLPIGVYLSDRDDEIIYQAAQEYVRAVATITDIAPPIFIVENFDEIDAGIVLQKISREIPYDGFSVKRKGNVVYILSSTSQGIFYGVHDFLEKNAEIVWGRGAYSLAADCISRDEIELVYYDYEESSPFKIRAWNMCGQGNKGDHKDDGTALYFGRNKLNGVMDAFDDAWNKFALRGYAVVSKATNINDLADSHPEYFMKDLDGKARINPRKRQSYINYYNAEVPNVIAKRIAEELEKNPNVGTLQYIMPDDPWFYMVENGQTLHDKPFTTDDGTTVFPDEENYKSTVYFNFINRVARRLKEYAPQAEIFTFAYMYSFPAPNVEIENNVFVMLAPISTNDKYAYADTRFAGNEKDKENIERWVKKCSKLCLYNYWGSFAGHIYSRPILDVVKKNLLWYRDIGVYGIMPECSMECCEESDLTEAQKKSRVYYDMNEAYLWVINKLIWNPEQDERALFERYCRIVYKECAAELTAYFNAVKKGWERSDGVVWYTTGGDMYILQFIINAGVKEDVLKALTAAKEKAKTPSVKARVTSIYDTVTAQIEKYDNFLLERAEMLFVEKEDILSQEAMDYRNNPKSVWNRAKSLTVLRDFKTLEFYPQEANFSCRMIYDGEKVYMGYTITDDQIVENRGGTLYREDGSMVTSYAETYIGGNDLNKSEYYGYISGFYERGEHFYKNEGTPKRIPIPNGVENKSFVRLSDKPEERYTFHVQIIPVSALNVRAEDFRPYGSFVYYTDRFGRAGWMGFGLWAKENFSAFNICKEVTEKHEEKR